LHDWHVPSSDRSAAKKTSDDLCKLGKEYLNALTCNFFSFSGQNLEYFDTSHTFLPLTELKLSVQKQSGFCILSVGLQENHRILITAMIIGTICAKSALCVCIKCCSVLFLFSGLGQFITRHGFHLNFLPFVKRFLLRIDPLCMEEFGHGMTRFKLVSLLCIYSASRQ